MTGKGPPGGLVLRGKQSIPVTTTEPAVSFLRAGQLKLVSHQINHFLLGIRFVFKFMFLRIFLLYLSN